MQQGLFCKELHRQVCVWRAIPWIRGHSELNMWEIVPSGLQRVHQGFSKPQSAEPRVSKSCDICRWKLCVQIEGAQHGGFPCGFPFNQPKKKQSTLEKTSPDAGVFSTTTSCGGNSSSSLVAIPSSRWSAWVGRGWVISASNQRLPIATKNSHACSIRIQRTIGICWSPFRVTQLFEGLPYPPSNFAMALDKGFCQRKMNAINLLGPADAVFLDVWRKGICQLQIPTSAK